MTKEKFFQPGKRYVRLDWTGTYSPLYFSVDRVQEDTFESVAWGLNYYLDGRGQPYTIEDFQDSGDWEMGNWVEI